MVKYADRQLNDTCLEPDCERGPTDEVTFVESDRIIVGWVCIEHAEEAMRTGKGQEMRYSASEPPVLVLAPPPPGSTTFG